MTGTVDRHGAKCDCGAVYTGPDSETWLAAHLASEHPTAASVQERFAHFADVAAATLPAKESFTRSEVHDLLTAVGARIRSVA